VRTLPRLLVCILLSCGGGAVEDAHLVRDIAEVDLDMPVRQDPAMDVAQSDKEAAPETAKDLARPEPPEEAPEATAFEVLDVPATDAMPDAPPVGMIKVVPAVIDFGFVPAGASAKLPFEVHNVGGGVLSVTRYTIMGSPGLTLLLGFDPKPISGGLEYKIQPPKLLQPGTAMSGAVIFSPVGPEPAQAEVRVFSSDENYPQGYPVFVAGNTKVPCLNFVPESVDFGVVLLGQEYDKVVKLAACSDVPVTVSDISVDEAGKTGGLSLGFDGFPGGLPPGPQTPLFIGSNDTYELKVRFKPTKLSTLDKYNNPLPQEFKVIAKDDSFLGMKMLDVTAVVVDKACVKTSIKVQEGDVVPVGTLLHLSSEGSSPFGPVVKWQWSLTKQPPENGGWLMPSSSSPNPVFMIAAPGDYEFRLGLWDSSGHGSCEEAVAVVKATSLNRALFVLTWQSVAPIENANPGHPGQDVDLHLAHPSAIGEDIDGDGQKDGYWDLTWDCFWYNPTPDFGVSPDPSVETRMIADAQAPPGPEVISQGLVCLDHVFRLGVHVFDDWYYGPVSVNLRVYIAGTLVYDATLQLKAFDFWDVGRLDCKTGVFTPVPGPKVSSYINPVFQVPH